MIAWVVGTLDVTLNFVTLAAYNLGNYRPVINDEAELIGVWRRRGGWRLRRSRSAA